MKDKSKSKSKKNSKWVPEMKKNAIKLFLDEIGRECQKFSMPLDISDRITSRIAVSGDFSGIPTYHFRWKHSNLPDLVIWPLTNEHISAVLKIANPLSIPITIRAGGSCYFGSSVATMGGIVLDMKRMVQNTIDYPKKIICVQAGATFQSVMNNLKLRTPGLSLPTYPTSFKSATVGGWFASNNEFGIGTIESGSFTKNVVEITVVKPNGDIETIVDPSVIEEYSNSLGTKGIITEMKIKLVETKYTVPYVFKFKDTDESLNAMMSLEKILENEHVKYLSVGDWLYYPEFQLVIFTDSEIHEQSPFIIEKIERIGGVYQGNDVSEEIKYQIHKLEIGPKNTQDLMMLQILTLKTQNIQQNVQLFHDLCKKYNIEKHNLNFVAGPEKDWRSMFYISTNNKDWSHFMATKAILHEVIKNALKNGDSCHTWGMQNTMYLVQYRKDLLENVRQAKLEMDPNLILNPLKLVQSKMSFLRADVMFRLSLWNRKSNLRSKPKQTKSSSELLKLENNLRKCIYCGFCRENCQSFTLCQAEEFTACGRIRILKYILEMNPSEKQVPQIDVISVLFSCATCAQCSASCPEMVDYTEIAELWRNNVVEKATKP